MDFVLLAWLFALAITVHNLEEALLLPDWSKTAGKWHHPVGAGEFRFAVVVLTLLGYVAAWLATVNGKESVGSYLVAGYAIAMLLNVLFPHAIATVVMRRYVPGTLTALLLNLPVTLLLLHQGFQEGYIHGERLAWAGPLVTVSIVAAIPALFYLGRRVPVFKEY